MTSVGCEMREVWAPSLQTRLRGAHLGARPSRLVCAAQAQAHRPRSTSAGHGAARLQVCGARVWRYGAAVCVQGCCRHTRARANAIQPLSCRATTRICVRGRWIMAYQTKSAVVPYPHRCALQICLTSSDRAVPVFGIRGPQLSLAQASMTHRPRH